MSLPDITVRQGKHGARLDVRVTPRATRNVVAGVRERALLVRVTAAPVGGAANEAVVALLADTLGVPKRSIDVVAGAGSRRKTIEVAGLGEAEVRARLSAILA